MKKNWGEHIQLNGEGNHTTDPKGSKRPCNLGVIYLVYFGSCLLTGLEELYNSEGLKYNRD